ncbi:hypothetical protein GCM10010156_76070 [Planobispora rosea]|uniref:Uncharacterized protein n=1 Tax=Planobispora rosea TaxID=35762 RepID=A0A8J3SAW1_PLARO|nr:hypothetical protein [Planobispora rosea]GGT07619.1 hypothetical protein GCM10010156_76070 [Planobispora rosea]GIH89211.1 hypothetical protein Pro02_76190 [Planobispora rosea]
MRDEAERLAADYQKMCDALQSDVTGIIDAVTPALSLVSDATRERLANIITELTELRDSTPEPPTNRGPTIACAARTSFPQTARLTISPENG